MNLAFHIQNQVFLWWVYKSSKTLENSGTFIMEREFLASKKFYGKSHKTSEHLLEVWNFLDSNSDNGEDIRGHYVNTEIKLRVS